MQRGKFRTTLQHGYSSAMLEMSGAWVQTCENKTSVVEVLGGEMKPLLLIALAVGLVGCSSDKCSADFVSTLQIKFSHCWHGEENTDDCKVIRGRVSYCTDTWMAEWKEENKKIIDAIRKDKP